MTATLPVAFAVPPDVTDGFTLDPVTGAFVTAGSRTGYAVAVPGTEQEIPATLTPATFAVAVAKLAALYGMAQATGRMLGAWYAPDDGVFMVELTDVLEVDRVTATGIGEARGQTAIFDLATGETVPTGGTGDR